MSVVDRVVGVEIHKGLDGTGANTAEQTMELGQYLNLDSMTY